MYSPFESNISVFRLTFGTSGEVLNLLILLSLDMLDEQGTVNNVR